RRRLAAPGTVRAGADVVHGPRLVVAAVAHGLPSWTAGAQYRAARSAARGPSRVAAPPERVRVPAHGEHLVDGVGLDREHRTYQLVALTVGEGTRANQLSRRTRR